MKQVSKKIGVKTKNYKPVLSQNVNNTKVHIRKSRKK